MEVDLLIRNARIFNPYFKRFIEADLAIKEGKFLYMGKKDTFKLKAKEELNVHRKYIVPGLIDIHMHIESSMATPFSFSQAIIKHGTTTIVSEPHEIANVFGVRAVKAMIENGKDSLVDIYYGLPSSVPATNPELETTGAVIDLKEFGELIGEKGIVCMGEVMNNLAVIKEENSKINQLIDFFKKNKPDAPLEGHIPTLLDLDLACFIYRGVDSDHTFQSVERLKQRIMNSVFVEIQEKSIKREIVDFIMDNNIYDRIALVTDDVMADSLIQEGHLDKLVRKVIKLGVSPEMAVYMATYTPAQRMGFKDRGAIAPGKIADFIILDDLQNFDINEVYKNGKAVSNLKNDYIPSFPADFYQSVHLQPLVEKDFEIKTPVNNGNISCRIMEVDKNSTYTKENIASLRCKRGKLRWEESPFALIAVFERHKGTRRRGIGLIGGDTIKAGAVATTYAHDHHNLLVIAHNLKDALLAANTVIKQNGGFCVVNNSKILANLKLPVAGILSERPVEEIGSEVAKIRKALLSLGYEHYNPIMSVSTNSLAVSPELKITDRGLVRVSESKLIKLFVEE